MPSLTPIHAILTPIHAISTPINALRAMYRTKSNGTQFIPHSPHLAVEAGLVSKHEQSSDHTWHREVPLSSITFIHFHVLGVISMLFGGGFHLI
jgi:hypothetical protein